LADLTAPGANAKGPNSTPAGSELSAAPGLRHSVEVEVVNEKGLHASPCTTIFDLAGQFKSTITIQKINSDGSAAEPRDANSIFELLQLAAGSGSTVKVTAVGTEDAAQACQAIKELIPSGFTES